MNEIIELISSYDEMNFNAFIRLVLGEKADKCLQRDFFIVMGLVDDRIRKVLYGRINEEAEKWMESEITAINLHEVNPAVAEENIKCALDEISKEAELMVAEREIGHQKILEYREIMKGYQDKFITDQMLNLPRPSEKKEYNYHAQFYELPVYDKSILLKANIMDCINDRQSSRKFSDKKLSMAELSYLLYSTQGIRKIIKEGERHLRTVPSGGARQPFETYLAINLIEGVIPGVYHYLPFENKIVQLFKDDALPEKLVQMSFQQKFVGHCAVTFIWSVIPYRTEWRYGTLAKKDIMQEAGHICQNLYLSCESIACGTCGINAYDQDKLDNFLGLDGKDEFVIYLAPVGKIID